jgi:hypothetical protein
MVINLYYRVDAKFPKAEDFCPVFSDPNHTTLDAAQTRANKISTKLDYRIVRVTEEVVEKVTRA